MRKRYILLQLFLIVHFAVCIAQQDKIVDSLQAVLGRQTRDTNKVRTLLALASRYRAIIIRNYSQPHSLQSRKYAEDALLLAKELNFRVGIADSYQSIGLTHVPWNYEEALRNYNLSLKLRTEMGNKPAVIESYFLIGNTYAAQGKLHEALASHFTYLKLCKEINYKLGIYSFYVMTESIYNRQGNYPESLKSNFAALKCAEEMGDKRRIANSTRRIASFFQAQGNLSLALKYYLAYIKKCEEAGDKVTDQYIPLAAIYELQGNYSEALKYYQAALKSSEETGNNQRSSGLYRDIAFVHRKRLNFSEALEMHRLQLKTCEKIGDKRSITHAYRCIGDTYLSWAVHIRKNDSMAYREQLCSEALKNYQVSLKISQEEGDKNVVCLSYAYIANVYREQKNFPAALSNYLNAIKTDGEQLYNLEYYIDISNVYIELKQFSEAKQVLNNALAYYKKNGDKQKIANCYDRQTALDSATGNWQGAYQNYRMFVLYRDSLANKENTEKILQLQIQSEFEKREDSLVFQQLLTDEKLKQQSLTVLHQQQTLLLKEKELALISGEKNIQQLLLEKNHSDLATQKAETEKKQGQLIVLNKEKDIQSMQIKKQKQFRNYLLIGLALLIIIASFGYFNYRTRQQLKLQIWRNKIASDLHDDVGSTLSSISIFSQMAQQQSKEAIPLLETIGDNSRKMLDAMADIVWTINPENDQFEKIVSRMKNFAYELLGAKNIDFEFNADEEVTKMSLSMDVRKNLYLIFKEATNNLVKYSGANKVAFSIKTEKNNLSMLISDNGRGFDQRQTTAGNGLKNMKKRAKEIGAQFMIQSNSGNGTIIELKVTV